MDKNTITGLRSDYWQFAGAVPVGTLLADGSLIAAIEDVPGTPLVRLTTFCGDSAEFHRAERLHLARP